jgi:hypothetical protein
LKGELLKTLTDSFTLSSVDKKTRMKSNSIYKTQLKPYLARGHDWMFTHTSTILDRFLEEEEKMERLSVLWKKINQLDSFDKRIFHLKYDVNFRQIRTNKRLGILMCCTEEHIRKMFLEKKESFIK